jgi:expansin (peptidoglycan-binding protein)
MKGLLMAKKPKPARFGSRLKILIALATLTAMLACSSGGSSNGSDGNGPPPVSDTGHVIAPAATCNIPAEGRPADISKATVVGDGTPGSCTAGELETAVQQGGVITFNCGPDPVTITLDRQIRINNVAGADGLGDTVIDGGGKVTLNGAGQTRILYQNACEKPWNSDHCDSFEHPRLTVQNLTFINGRVDDAEKGGGAIYAQGGVLKVIDCNFFGNQCAATGQDVAGGAIFTVLQAEPVYIVGSIFGDIDHPGNSCSNGGAIGGIHTSYTVINSVIYGNSATGTGANPGNGGNGGGICNDGTTYTLSLCGSIVSQNTANAIGGGIFYVSNDGTGHTVINNSAIVDNRVTQGSSGPRQAGGLYLQGTAALITNSTIATNSAPYAAGLNEYANLGSGSLDTVNVTLAGQAGAALVVADDIGGTLQNSTISGNTRGIDAGQGLTLANTIVAGNQEGNCSATHPDGGGNLQFPAGGTPCTAGITIADPLLGELQYNGGAQHLLTMAPAAGSPAIGAGQGCPDTDQRAADRPADGCTSGAYEVVDTDGDAGSGDDARGLCTRGELRNYDDGSLTWYYFAQGAGEVNCGFAAHPVGTASDPRGDWVEHVATGNGRFFGAMNAADYDNAAVCGACVEITRQDTGRKVTVTIVDRCPECPPGHIDLSADAFAELEDLDLGCVGPSQGCQHYRISWRYVACPVTEDISFRLQPPTNPWWRSFLVQDHRYPISKLAIEVNGAWQQAVRQDYNYWLVGDGNIGPAPWPVRLTDVNGSVVQATIDAAADGDIPGDIQFPPCH